MNNTIEYILCAAVHYDDGVFYRDFPKGIKTGFIVSGYRHSDVIVFTALVLNRKTKSEDKQGFLTSKNRFVSREEAAKIAYKSGQIKKEVEMLISEDLYRSEKEQW